MKLRAKTFFGWLIHHPTALINVLGIIIIVGGFSGYLYYQAHRSIDVLQDWHIALSSPKESRNVGGTIVAVYHPNESLVFTSVSTKLTEAEGNSVRTIVCEATDTQGLREIQLDQIPATRPAGDSPKRENAVTVPDVSQFAGLPRWCKLVIDITYKDVNGTGRTQQEHAETARFLVEEAKLDTQGLLNKILDLENQINELKAQLPTNGGSATSVQNTPTTPVSKAPTTTTNTGGSSTSNTSTTNNNTTVNNPPADDRSALGKLPVVGGLFNAIGL